MVTPHLTQWETSCRIPSAFQSPHMTPPSGYAAFGCAFGFGRTLALATAITRRWFNSSGTANRKSSGVSNPQALHTLTANHNSAVTISQ